MKSRLLRLIFTDSHKRGIVVRSMFWLAYYRFALWTFPSAVTRNAVIDLDGGELGNERSNKALVSDVMRSVRQCSRFVPFASCLTQALAAKEVLKGYGQSSTVRIGVAPKDLTIEAHAWLEVEGRIVLGRLAHHTHFSAMTSRSQIAP